MMYGPCLLSIVKMIYFQDSLTYLLSVYETDLD